MKFISTPEAAAQKNTTREAIIGAIRRGEIDAERLGQRAWAVKVNRKLEEWHPSGRQRSGKARWAKASAGKTKASKKKVRK